MNFESEATIVDTRFDGTLWITARGLALAPAEMETDHLLNTLNMLMQKPVLVVNMLIRDIESCSDNISVPWIKERAAGLKRQSIQNVTSMSVDDVREYAYNSPLVQAICNELEARGVNVSNYLDISAVTYTPCTH